MSKKFGFILFFSLVFSCSFAQTTQPQQKPPPQAEQSASNRDPLEVASAKSLTDGEAVWIDEGNGKEFLAVYREAQTKNTEGAIILLLDQYEAIDTFDLIAPLQRKLPLKGWSTLTVTMLPPPKRSDDSSLTLEKNAAAATENSGDDAQWRDVETRSLARIKQSLIWLRKKDRFSKTVIIGHGTGGLWAAGYLTNGTEDVRTLILISAYPPREGKLGNDLHDKLARLRIPVFDVFAEHDYDFVIQAAGDRHSRAKRNPKGKYRRYLMFGEDFTYSRSLDDLVKLIRGWIRIEKKKKKKEKDIETDIITA